MGNLIEQHQATSALRELLSKLKIRAAHKKRFFWDPNYNGGMGREYCV